MRDREIARLSQHVDPALVSAWAWVDLVHIEYAKWKLRQVTDPTFTNETKCLRVITSKQVKDDRSVVNLRNTYSQVPGREHEKIGVQKYVTQLAILLNPKARNLVKRTLTGPLEKGSTNPHAYQISHLCHNKWCIEPMHLVIELACHNRARDGCKDSSKIFLPQLDIVIDPCPHANLAFPYESCVVPRRTYKLPLSRLDPTTLGEVVSKPRDPARTLTITLDTDGQLKDHGLVVRPDVTQ